MEQSLQHCAEKYQLNRNNEKAEDFCAHVDRLIVVDSAFLKGLQVACRNMSKESLKMKFVDTLGLSNQQKIIIEPTTALGK